MYTYLITGTSRGIGLELTKHLLLQPQSSISTIIAHPNRVIDLIIKDLTSQQALQSAISELQTIHNISSVDVLINNAGMIPYSPEGIATMSATDLREVLDTNVVSVQVVTSAFIPLLEQGKEKKVMNISSMLGSLTLARKFAQTPAQGYKVSKTALTMLTVQWALEYEKRGFTFLSISPGWLKSELGSEYADLEVPVGVAGVLDIIRSAESSQTGRYLSVRVEGWGKDVEGVKEGKRNVYDGEDIAW